MHGAATPRPVWVVGAALILIAGCATTASIGRPTPPTASPRLGSEESGLASWYGRAHHGRRTASDEVFDMHALTAAHRTLPFGTRVRVTHAETGRAVEVRINDRGPWKDGRVIDLSYEAARRLGAVAAGVVPVTVRVIGLPDGTREPLSGGAPHPASRSR